jgi:hypothetical protein
MMEHSYFLEKYARMRQQEFEEEARLARLIQEIKAEKPGLWHYFIWQIGDWLIVLGQKLVGDTFNGAEIEYGIAQSGPQKHCLHSE